MEFVLTGETQARAHQFLSTLKALELEERTGLQMSSRGSVLQAAKQHGYVPEGVRTKKKAITYMSYLRTLLLRGGFARMYAEEIIMGNLTFYSYDKCGCPNYAATSKPNRLGLLPGETSTMCIHQEKE